MALADPTRQRIIELLAQRELSSGEIADQFEISAPAVSQHLKILKRAQFVKSRTDGQRRIYGLDQNGFQELENWLMDIKQYWGSRLERLECELRISEGGIRNKRKRGRKGIKT